jgi:exodeoxyribonuclease V gamma subunit
VRHELARIFAADPSIAVHEVAILCPDPQAVEGLARAIFGSTGEGPPIDLQRRLQQRPEEDALEVAQRLVELLPSRWPASAVLDLLSHPLVQVHHPCDLQRVRRWLDHADVRWGVDAQHQQELGVPCTGLGTWRRGLLRLELAAWHGEDVSTAKRWVGERDDPGVVPAAGIQEEDIPMVRALAALLCPLLDAAARWRSTRQPEAWCVDLDRLLDGLIGSGHERSGPRQVLNAWRGGFAASASIPEMRAEVLRAVLSDGIRRPGVRLSGGLTLGSVSELGGLPWRVVALIGMDDGAFPRQIVLRDLDPLAMARRGSDPDPRADDRLRLLQTVCTVRDHLVVAWSGRESIKGEVLPSSPVIQELIEVAAQLAHCPMEQLIIHHRLHAAHERPASWPSAALREQAAAFARAQLHADDGELSDGAPRPPRPLPRAEATTLEIGEFLSTWKNPPAAFLRALGLSLHERVKTPRDYELFDMEGLDRWQLDQRLFAGANIDQLTAEGVLPPPPFSLAEFGQRQHKNRAISAWWATVQSRLMQLRIDITCAGLQINGVLGDILPGIGPVLARTSKPGARHLLDHALRTVIWRVATSQTGGGLVACSGTKKASVDVCQWSYCHSRGGDQGLLQEMVAFTLRARCQPLPIMPELASAMLAAVDALPTYQGSVTDEAELMRSGREFWLSDLQEHHPGASERGQESCRRLWPDGESMFADRVLTRELIELLAPFLSDQAWSPGQVEP